MGVVVASLVRIFEAVSGSGTAQLLRQGVEGVPSEKVPSGGHDDTDNVPAKSFRDDVKRKIALKKVMGPPQDDKKNSEAVPSSFSDEPAGMDDKPDLDSVGMGSDDDDASGTAQGDQWTKEEVNYRYSGDKEQNCGNCTHFKYPGACEIISGLIRVVDVCDKFESANEPSSFGWENPNPAEKDDNVVTAELVKGGGGMGGSYGVVASEVVEAPASTWGMVTKSRASEVDFWPVEDRGNAVSAGARVLRGPSQRGDGPHGQRDSLKKGPLWTGEGGPGSGPSGGGKKYPTGPGSGSRAAIKKSTRGMNREDADDISDTVNSEVAPPGGEKVVKALKKKPGIKSPYAVAWSMKNKGYLGEATRESLIQRLAMHFAGLEEAGANRHAPFVSSRRT